MSQPAKAPDHEATQSHTRIRSARRAAVEVDEHERPTVVPSEPPGDRHEARVLYEVRAAEERRRSAASLEHERPTKRVAQRTLMGMSPPREEPEPIVAPVSERAVTVDAPPRATLDAAPRVAPRPRTPLVAITIVACAVTFTIAAFIGARDPGLVHTRQAIARALP